jgi:hypothetical protein
MLEDDKSDGRSEHGLRSPLRGSWNGGLKSYELVGCFSSIERAVEPLDTMQLVDYPPEADGSANDGST